MEQYLKIQSNQRVSNYTAVEKTLKRQKQLVVPVTMIVQGVLNGSQGPILHLVEDFGKIPESWDGIPIVINHPEKNGKAVSANDPDVLESVMVGHIFNAIIENNTLKAEAWLDVNDLNSISPAIATSIGSNEPIEVSVGVFTENEPISGEYNGIKYDAIARNHRPDHLALLPGGVGACSLENGCGIYSQKKGEQNVETVEAIKLLQSNGVKVPVIVDNSSKGLQAKIDSLRDLVRSKNPVRAKDSTEPWIYYYLIEAYDSYLIYEKDVDGSEDTYFQQNYIFAVPDGKPEFVGEPIEVVKNIEYKPVVETNEALETNEGEKKEVTIMSEIKKCTPCVEKRVNELIANKATKFNEDNREWLQTMSEAELDFLVPVVEAVAPVVNAAPALSAEDRMALEFGKKGLLARKATLKASIMANSVEGSWTPEVLDNMDDSMLERIEAAIPKKEAPVDYSLNGIPNVNRGMIQMNAEDNLYPAGVEVK